ncbi:hypothetical protein G6O69_31640 [Pseudenhygromyxa sp. WMMC2535]|uniref:hypothetical protein n=1 Tax=Pseudenhygromyxa sp. WMMC2535 TaxID=2712867 RepID=UPI001555E750|nr:hypothetical protein [Pseudenhygromyxa sp. WMMC2535]NVB42419.1 hypothetical protein [Pseudenhygromyxa sp. WMMC2535]
MTSKIFVGILGLATLGCAATQRVASRAGPSASTSDPAAAAAQATPSEDARVARERSARYALAIHDFNTGHYEQAAQLFAQLLLSLPRDPSADHLRNLLVQQIAWSLLGSHDVHARTDALDRGERMLERYLVKHEALLPESAGEREAIYELLGQYALRRDAQPPPDVNTQLRALNEQTIAALDHGEGRTRAATVDRMVREIEVERIAWAKPDDPRVQAFFRDPRAEGPSLFGKPFEPFHPARVLVRGWTSQVAGLRTRKQNHALIAAARPELERCYEQALGRGADVVERAAIDLTWRADASAEVELEGEHRLDASAERCVLTALRTASADAVDAPDPAHTMLRLTFFVQSEGHRPGAAEINYAFGLRHPPLRGQIEQGASGQHGLASD